MSEHSPATSPGPTAARSRPETGDDRTRHISLAAALGGTLLSICPAVAPGPAKVAAARGTGHGLEYA